VATFAVKIKTVNILYFNCCWENRR